MDNRYIGHPARKRLAGNAGGGQVLTREASKAIMERRGADTSTRRIPQAQAQAQDGGFDPKRAGRAIIHAVALELGMKPYQLKAAWKLSAAGFRDVETDPQPITFAYSTDTATDIDGFAELTDTQTKTVVIKSDSHDRYSDGIEVSCDAEGADDGAIVKLKVVGLGPSPRVYNIGREPRFIAIEDWLDGDIQFVLSNKASSNAAPVTVLFTGMCGLPADEE